MSKVFIRTKNFKCVLVFLIFLFSISLNIITVYADSPAPHTPYTIELENGDKIFCMTPNFLLNPDSPEQYSDYPGYSEDLLESGLYDKTDGMKCLYTISQYIYQWDLFLSADGRNYAVMEWLNSNETVGIKFYADGALYKSYSVSDLMIDMDKREFSVSHYTWNYSDKREFDMETGILSITTYDNINVVFDINTGKMISNPNLNPDEPVSLNDFSTDESVSENHTEEDILKEFNYKSPLIGLTAVIIIIIVIALYINFKKKQNYTV